MISVVVVYNDDRVFKEILRRSLRGQTAEYELIALDNTHGKFKSASEALNYGGKKANGKYIMFVHQDVELDSSSWLEEVEKILDNIPDLGIAGVAGATKEKNKFGEHYRGHISNGGATWDRRIEKEEVVQILDELLLIIPRSVFDKMTFDEITFDHWHCYGADYCLSVRKLGLKAYVIPAFVYHRTPGSNMSNFGMYQRRLYHKHKNENKHLYTTLGEISWARSKMIALTDIVRPTYLKIFPEWIDYLKRDLYGCNVVLDLGCGYNSPIRRCDVTFSIGVESSRHNLDESMGKRIHNQYINSEIQHVEFKPKSFDAVISINSLDDLSKEEGRKLIKQMEMWAKNKIIVVIANGGSNEDEPEADMQRLDIKDLKRMGFKIYGIHGWKRLGKYDASKQNRRIMADLTQKITYKNPKYASNIYAVKES